MRHPIWTALQRFWKSDRGLTELLALLIFVVFVLPALGWTGTLATIVREVGFSALLIAAALTLPKRPWLRRFLLSFTVATLLLRWAGMAGLAADLAAWREISTLILLVLFAVVAAVLVYRPGPVTYHRIQGAIAVYLLLGLIWAGAYELVHLVHPNAFTGVREGVVEAPNWIYYSFITITTTGYGDIAPVHPLARSLAIAEAVTGQLYIAVTLARLVSLQISSRHR